MPGVEDHARVAALGIACVMLVAMLKVHWPHGFFMNWSGDQKGEGFEFHLLALGMATARALLRRGQEWSVRRAYLEDDNSCWSLTLVGRPDLHVDELEERLTGFLGYRLTPVKLQRDCAE